MLNTLSRVNNIIHHAKGFLSVPIADTDEDKRCLLIILLSAYRDKDVNVNELNRKYFLTADGKKLRQYVEFVLFLGHALDSYFKKMSLTDCRSVVENVPEWLVYQDKNQMTKDIRRFVLRH